MKRFEVYYFRAGLKRTAFKTPRCTYAVNKNIKLVESEIEDMEKGNINPSEDMEKYLEEQQALNIKHTPKDTKGEPKVIKDIDELGETRMRYDIEGLNDPKSAYSKELKKIQEKYKEAIDEHAKKVTIYNQKFLMEESEFKPFQIPIDAFDNEVFSQKIMDGIAWMIKDE